MMTSGDRGTVPITGRPVWLAQALTTTSTAPFT
jgi:hypothetical protein